jgi:hypothetical protein
LNQRSIKLGIAATTLMIILLTSGCATQYGQRVKDDFRDTFKLYAGVGIGLHADVKVTNFMHPGIGWAGLWLNAGLRDRYSTFVFPSQESAMFPLWAITAPFTMEEKDWFLSESLRMANGRLIGHENPHREYFVLGSLFDLSGIQAFEAYGIQKIAKHPTMLKGHSEQAYTEKPLGIELGLGLLLLNVRIGFDPVEFVDLITTCFGWDMLQDNKSIDVAPVIDGESLIPQKESMISKSPEKKE